MSLFFAENYRFSKAHCQHTRPSSFTVPIRTKSRLRPGQKCVMGAASQGLFSPVPVPSGASMRTSISPCCAKLMVAFKQKDDVVLAWLPPCTEDRRTSVPRNVFHTRGLQSNRIWKAQRMPSVLIVARVCLGHPYMAKKLENRDRPPSRLLD